ncbi:hypothetical protein VaNZ11_000318, partial [Volvox africanus]
PRSPASAYMYSTGAAIDKQQLSAAGSAESTHIRDPSARSASPRAPMPMRRLPRRVSLASDPYPEAARSPHNLRNYQHPQIAATDSGRLATRSPTPPPGGASGTGRQDHDRASPPTDPIESPLHAVLHSSVVAGMQRPRRARGATSRSSDGDGGSSASEPIAATQRHSFPGWDPGTAFLTRDHAVGAWAQDCAQEHLRQGPLQQQQQMDRVPTLTAPESYGRLVAAISEVSSEGRIVRGRPGAAGAGSTGSICSREEERTVVASSGQEDADVAAGGEPNQRDGDPAGFQEPSVRCAKSGGKVRAKPPASVVVPEGLVTSTLAAADEPVVEAVAVPEIWPDVDVGTEKPPLPPPPEQQQQEQEQPAAAVSLAAPGAVSSAPRRISDMHQEWTSAASGGTGAGAVHARARRGLASSRAGAAFTTKRLSLDMLPPGSTFTAAAAAAGTSAAAPAGPGTSTDINSPGPPTSVLYGSPLRHVSVSMKLATPPGAQYSDLEAALMATAHRNIQTVLSSGHSGRSGNVATGVGAVESRGHMPWGSQDNRGIAGGE